MFLLFIYFCYNNNDNSYYYCVYICAWLCKYMQSLVVGINCHPQFHLHYDFYDN